MKVFFLGRYNQTEVLTGPEKAAKRISAIYAKKNESVFIEYFFDGRQFGLKKKLFGSEIINNNSNLRVHRLGLLSLLFFLFRHKPTTIHIVTFERFTMVAFLYRLLANVKIVCGFQGNVHFENTKYKDTGAMYRFKDYICEKIILKFSDTVFFLSDTSAEISRSIHNFSKTKVMIIPNGIDEIFNTYGKSKSFSPEAELKIVFTGNVNRKEKGFDFLAGALNNVSFNYKLYLLSNETKFETENFIAVPLMDTVSLARFLADKDVFISSSEYEPFSIAAAEAMAEGLITIATIQTGMAKYITNSSDGFTFNYNDSKGLSSLLVELNQSRDQFPGISKRGILIYQKLSWEKITDIYKEHYI